jgi:translation initiation factor IF-1
MMTYILYMSTPDKDDIIVLATVIEALPNAMFRVKLKDNDQPMVAYLSGKMKLHRIKVLLGDTVSVLLDPYGGKGRIVKRM